MKHHKQQTFPLPLEKGDVLEFHAKAADLSIVPLQSGEPRLEVVMHSPRRHQGVQIDRRTSQNGRSTVSVDLSVHDHVQVCLIVPNHVIARVHSDFGRVRIENFNDCDIDVFSNAGMIIAQNVSGSVHFRSSAGTIIGRQLSGNVHAETNAGSIKLWIDALNEGTHVVRTNMGAVKLLLKSGIDVRIDAEAHMGSVRSKYPSNPQAKVVLSVRTDLGSVKVVDAGEDKKPEDWFDIESWTDWVGRWWSKSMQAEAERGSISIVGEDTAPASSRREAPAQILRPSVAPEGVQRQESPKRSGVPETQEEDSIHMILSMVQDGKISPTEAEKLLRAIDRANC